MATLYRNKKDGRLYFVYRVSPPKYTGEWLEMEDVLTGKRKKVPQSLEKYLVPVAHR